MSNERTPVGFGIEELPVGERARLADLEMRRLFRLEHKVSIKTQTIIFNRFGLTDDNGGTDAFLEIQNQRIKKNNELNAGYRKLIEESRRNPLEKLVREIGEEIKDRIRNRKKG